MVFSYSNNAEGIFGSFAVWTLPDGTTMAELEEKTVFGFDDAAEMKAISHKAYFGEGSEQSVLLDGLSDQAPGRPESDDNPVEAALEKQLEEAKRQNAVLEQKMALKDLVADFHIRYQKDRMKKK